MSQKESEWEDELKFEIMEEYISEARNFHALVDKKEGMKRIREHFEKLKTFIYQKIATAVSNREKEIAEEVKDSFWECPTHGEPMSPTNCRDCNECLEVNIVLSSLLQILKHRQQENHTLPLADNYENHGNL